MSNPEETQPNTSTNYNRLIDEGDGVTAVETGEGAVPTSASGMSNDTAVSISMSALEEKMITEKLEQGQIIDEVQPQPRSFSDRLLDAAVQADLVETQSKLNMKDAVETEDALMVDPGIAENQAKSHVTVRMGRIFLGLTIVLLGILTLPLPGPGWLIIIGGLSVLAKDFIWAARVISFIRRSIPGLPDEDEGIPCHVWVLVIVSTIAISAFSVWWCLYGGQAIVCGWFGF